MNKLEHTKIVLIDDPEYEIICSKIYKSLPDARISYVLRIENPDCSNKYQAKLESSHLYKTTEEKYLFHGTNSDYVVPILQNGFKAELNRNSAYGRGTYLAKTAAYSKSYSQVSPYLYRTSNRNSQIQMDTPITYMFVCSALLGKVGKFGSDQPIDSSIADSGVDNFCNPEIYVIPDDDRVLPRYLVGLYSQGFVQDFYETN